MDFLDVSILDNTVRSYLLVIGIIFFLLILKRFLSHYIAAGIYIFVSSYWKSVEKKTFIKLIIKPLGWFLTISITIFMFYKLNYPSAWDVKIYQVPLETIIKKTGLILIIYSIIRLTLSILNFIALILGEKAGDTLDKNDDQLVIFFRDFLKVIIAIIGFLILLKAVFNQDIGRLLTGLSIVGAAMALAAKESLENLIASFIIFFDKPFHVGDLLKVNTVMGTVEAIGLRSTRIRTLEKTLVTVPNKQMVDGVVDNYSMRSQRRADMKLEVTSKTSPEKIENFVQEIINTFEGKGEEIEKKLVFVSSVDNRGTTITVEYFTAPYTIDEFNRLKQDVNLQVLKIMEKNKINFSASGGNINLMQNDLSAGTTKSQSII